MTPQARIAIIGLERIGASIGLALSQPEYNLQVIGSDPDPGAAAKATKAGAVQKTHWNLLEAVDGADVVILARPLGAIRDTLTSIAGGLKDNCVVTDTASLKVPVMRWAEEILPPGVYFVGGHPMLSSAALLEPGQGVDAARRDLFSQAAYCLTPSVETPPDAVKLISDLIFILGAEPFYMDADEHDALIGAVDTLPLMLHLALTRTVVGDRNWRDTRRVANRSFALTTTLVDAEAASVGAELTLNRTHLLRWLDLLHQQLHELRTLIESGESEKLEAIVEAAGAERYNWLRDLKQAQWQESPRPPVIPDTAERMGQFFGFNLFRRKPKESPDKGNEKRRP